MLNHLMRALLLFSLLLAGCDNRESQTASASSAEVKVALPESRLSFELPPSFSDQTAQAGIVNDGDATMRLFIDINARQRVLVSEATLPEAQEGDRTVTLADLGSGILNGLTDYYQDIYVTADRELTLAGRQFQRLDTLQSINDQVVAASTLFTLAAPKVVTLQILTPSDQGEAHRALVQRITDTLRVN